MRALKTMAVIKDAITASTDETYRNSVLVDKIKSANKLKYYKMMPPNCPTCGSTQVQLVNWVFVFPPQWRCRKCMRRFKF